MYCAKTAEAIEMQLGVLGLTYVGPRNHVLYRFIRNKCRIKKKKRENRQKNTHKNERLVLDGVEILHGKGNF